MMRFISSILIVLASVVLGSFVWFIQTIPSSPNMHLPKTDAIVVLTGGNGRVERGLLALAGGEAPVLLVSGVGAGVTRGQLIAAHSSRMVGARLAVMEADIVLDYVANTTRTNADQAAEFVRKRNVKTLRLVTANYHMPRSLLEFSLKMPQVTIVPDPVFPEGFRRHSWWQDETTRALVFSEYLKYFAVLLRREVGE